MLTQRGKMTYPECQSNKMQIMDLNPDCLTSACACNYHSTGPLKACSAQAGSWSSVPSQWGLWPEQSQCGSSSKNTIRHSVSPLYALSTHHSFTRLTLGRKDCSSLILQKGTEAYGGRAGQCWVLSVGESPAFPKLSCLPPTGAGLGETVCAQQQAKGPPTDGGQSEGAVIITLINMQLF